MVLVGFLSRNITIKVELRRSFGYLKNGLARSSKYGLLCTRKWKVWRFYTFASSTYDICIWPTVAGRW